MSLGNTAIAVAVGLPFSRADIERTIPECFERAVEHFPDQLALTGSGRRWTYLELNQRVNRIAYAIRSVTTPGDGCVAFLAGQSPEMVIATLAIVKAAKIYLAIHPSMPAASQCDIVRDSAPELLLATAGLAPRAREIAAGICDVLILDEAGDSFPVENPPILAKPESPSTIFYTSGSTGHPKGVVKSHRSVLQRVWLSTRHDRVGPSDRQSLLAHCTFSASESDIFCALLQGAAVCVFDIVTEGLAAFRAWIEEERITLLHPPVLLFRGFLSTLEGANLFPSVRVVALAGDVVLPSDVEKWRRHFSSSCSLLNRFSTTETALLTVGRIEHDSVLAGGFVAAGRPVADKTVLLIDEAGQPVQSGETGEVVVRSAYLADGYWRHPRETAAAFHADPDVPGQRVYRTGDLARFLPDGTLQFVARREHLAKVRGYRVDTREVESALSQLEGVSAAAVVVRREHDEDRLCGFVVMQPGAGFDPGAMRARLREDLPEWKIPARLESIPEMPMTLSGKIDRQLLGGAAPRPASSTPSVQAATLEQELVDIWTVTLRRDDVPHDAHFLDLGGDSISAMLALNWIERLYSIRLTVAELLQHGTIRRVAARLRNGASAAATVLAPLPVDNVADAYLELLNAHAVDYVFINPGTDTAPILESIAKFKAQGRRVPELLLCLHESLAMAAAHGYFMVSRRPQVVMVHVDVGTQNLGANLHNAQRGRAGVVICAGRAPYTMDAAHPGGRNRHNHWVQEQFSQDGIVAGYVKWRYELTRRENLPLAVQRAFQIAAAEPAGPVYLVLPREVLVEKAEASAAAPKPHPSTSIPAVDPAALSQAARWLIEAVNPLILVSYAGRNPEAVASLVRLAETLAAPVIESRHRLNFPSSHPLHFGYSAIGSISHSDCVLVIDHDVPWVPSQCRPAAGARIIHLDIDPLKQDIPIWGFPVDLSIHADSSVACIALAGEIERQITPEARLRIEDRRRVLAAEHDATKARLRQRALDQSEQSPIAAEWAAYCLNHVVDNDTLIVAEAVTNTPALWNHLQLDVPGSYYQSLGSGLGWGLGAALGAKLASPSKTVICIVGDGSWVFGGPIAAYWAAQQRACPFLTVIFNNQEYLATSEAIATMAPEGYARKSGRYPACDLPQPPMYSNVAAAMGLWAKTVDQPAALPSVLREAIDEVRRGRCALVDICVAAPRPGSSES